MGQSERCAALVSTIESLDHALEKIVFS